MHGKTGLRLEVQRESPTFLSMQMELLAVLSQRIFLKKNRQVLQRLLGQSLEMQSSSQQAIVLHPNSYLVPHALKSVDDATLLMKAHGSSYGLSMRPCLNQLRTGDGLQYIIHSPDQSRNLHRHLNQIQQRLLLMHMTSFLTELNWVAVQSVSMIALCRKMSLQSLDSPMKKRRANLDSY